VPQAIRAFYDSTDFEDAVRAAVSLGGARDTLTCITGDIAQAFSGGVPEHIQAKAYEILDDRLGGNCAAIHTVLTPFLTKHA
jgi:ADP-ribosylglycohydrolase